MSGLRSRASWFRPGVILAASAAVALAVAALPRGASAAGEGAVSEYRVKAAFLRNFVKFIEWPSRPTGTLTLCILGEDPFAGDLRGSDDVGGGRTLAYRRLAGAEEAGDCQALFVAQGERRELPAILAALSGREVLTVGDGEGMAREGLMLSFLIEGGKVRFDANLGSIRQSGLTVSSRLLGLAKTVHDTR